jgi:hypothetical protein
VFVPSEDQHGVGLGERREQGLFQAFIAPADLQAVFPVRPDRHGFVEPCPVIP